MDRLHRFKKFEKVFWRLSRKVEYLWRDIFTKTFPGSQSYIMYLLKQDGPHKMSELAQALHLSNGAVTAASDQLIEHGFITRIHDDKDRRIVRLDLTTKGSETLNNLEQEGREILEQIFHEASDSDIERMYILFKQAMYNIERF